MVPFILDWLHELIMPHPERDGGMRMLKRFGLILVISIVGVAIFG
jgi:hypothetical protein